MTSRTDRQKLNRQKQTLPTFISIRWGLWRKSRSKIICFQFSQGFQIFVLNTKFYLMDQHLIWLRRICKHFYVKFEKKNRFICCYFYMFYIFSVLCDFSTTFKKTSRLKNWPKVTKSSNLLERLYKHCDESSQQSTLSRSSQLVHWRLFVLDPFVVTAINNAFVVLGAFCILTDPSYTH